MAARGWSIIGRGFWVNGGTDLRSWIQAIAPDAIEGRLEQITCPVHGSAAEDDPLAKGAAGILDRITSPTSLVRFTAAEGAGTHVELQKRGGARDERPRLARRHAPLTTGRSAWPGDQRPRGPGSCSSEPARLEATLDQEDTT